MADGDELTAEQEVVRYARPSDVPNGFLLSTAFERPEKDKNGLSICQLYVFSPHLDADLVALRQVLGAWMNLKPNGRFAQLSVADIVAVGEEVAQTLSVVEDPVAAQGDKPANPAHSLIVGLPFKGADQGELGAVLASDLLARKVSELHGIA